MEYSREMLKGSTDSLLLSLLAEQAMYGYQLVKELQHRSKGYFQFREGTLYPALHRLEQDGLVEARWQTSMVGHKRRYYFITEKGNLALSTKLSQWHGFSHAVSMVLSAGRSLSASA